MDFEQVLRTHWRAIERYVSFRIGHRADAEDVLQEIWSAAAKGYPALRDVDKVKPWLVGIARYKCADWIRQKYQRCEVPLEQAERLQMLPLPFGRAMDSPVLETLERLDAQDQQLLRLCYFHSLPQKEIARQLGIPLGTVKSRLHTAREKFKAAFPCQTKGAYEMKMPKMMPDYTIVASELPPFACQWEELMGWFIVPKLGERLSWAMYDFPERIRTEMDEMEVTGRAVVHGIEGVEIGVRTFNPMGSNQTGDDDAYVQRSFVAQLTQSHCRILSETHERGGVKYMYTFLDGDDFLNNWGFGEDNCGNETHLCVKGLVTGSRSALVTHSSQPALDVVGRYNVVVGGKIYDTIRVVMTPGAYEEGMLSEQYIDQNGRTVLWRRFNADDWRLDRYGSSWRERFPENETLTLDGKTYVHWYDCITSYIL